MAHPEQKPTSRSSILGTNATRFTRTNSDGLYEFVNTDVGSYKLKVEAPGFQAAGYQPFDLAARQTVRIDVDLKVASQATSVTVEAVPVVQTDVSNISESKGNLQLTDLPVAIGTRSSGSTSAYSTLTAQPGLQIDNANNIMVAGAGPSQLSISIDSISSVGPGSLGALTEMFPSFNAIEEIKISETLNPAEFGGVADITTFSRSGMNEFHGGQVANAFNHSTGQAGRGRGAPCLGGMAHGFFTTEPDVPETKEVWDVVVKFFAKHLGAE
jgi:hypothetical protein